MIGRLMSQALSALFTETQEKIPDRVGQRPRWEWFTKEVIRGNGSGQETPMVTRYRLVKTPRGSLFVHQWHRPDSDRDCHDHPWWFGTLVLSGGYTEEVRILPGDPASWVRRHTRRPLSWHAMPLNQAHRVIELKPNTWTLLLIGPKVRSWGFYVHDRFGVPSMAEIAADREGLRTGNVQMNPIPPTYVPWATYIAQGGNPDPFNC